MRLGFWNVDHSMTAVKLMATAAGPPALMALAEGPPSSSVEAELAALGQRWVHLPGTGDKIDVFRRAGTPPVRIRATLERGVILEITPEDGPSLLVVIVHLRDQRNHSPEFLAPFIISLRDAVLREEGLAGHRRTLLVGDLNLSPFDRGLNHPRLILGAMDKRKARRLARETKTREAAFYNPMWSRLGDATPGPPGTFYRGEGSHIDTYFYTVDQLLIRPDAIDCVRKLDVPRTLGGVSLVSENDIPLKRISDHLPIIFDVSWSRS